MSSTPGDAPLEEQRSDDGPGMRDVAELLTVPARGGLVLTKERLGLLAVSLGLPIGFGERNRMVRQMFQAAAELDRLPALIEALQCEAATWESRYLEWSREYPASAGIWSEWQGRLVALKTLLETMQQAAATAQRVDTITTADLPQPVDDQAEYQD